MAGAAEQTVVLEPAFAAAVGDRDDVICFPAGPLGPPLAARGAIGGGGLAPAPFPMRLQHVQSAQPADALVAFLHFAARVPGAGAALPLWHTPVAADRPARRRDGAAAPAADRLAVRAALRYSPLIGRHHPLPHGTHGAVYRQKRPRSLYDRGLWNTINDSRSSSAAD